MVKEKNPKGSSSIILIGLLLASLMIRSINLGQQSLSFDEAWSWMVAQGSWDQLKQILVLDPHPPLYYLFLKGLLALSPATEAGLRLLSVFSSGLSLSVIMAFAAWRWNARVAIYAGVLTLLSSFDIYFSQDARMYALLAHLWLLSYVLLSSALEGYRSWFGWGLSLVALAWTHFYGLLVVLTQIIFLLLSRVVSRSRSQLSNLHWRSAKLVVVLTAIGVIPIGALLWHYRKAAPGGAWVPTWHDVQNLFNLSSVGLSSVPQHYPDPGHLLWLPGAALSPTAWLAIGMLWGGLAIYGLFSVWRLKPERRSQVLLTLAMFIMPVGLAYTTAVKLQRPFWALKPFLGNAYILYLWVAIGLDSLTSTRVRSGLLLILSIISALPLFPYFSSWRKNDAKLAFNHLSAKDPGSVVLLEPAYLFPLADYYLGPGTTYWQLALDGQTGVEVRTFNGSRVIQDPGIPLDCQAPTVAEVDDIWVYHSYDRIQSFWEDLPTCIREKQIWVFQGGDWVPLSTAVTESKINYFHLSESAAQAR